MKKNLLGLYQEELKDFIINLGEKPFRAKQLFKWINSGERDFRNMSNISLALQERLEQEAFIGNIETMDIQHDEKDGTKKFLFQLEDFKSIESVFMKYKYGNSLCISSQVGCKMGCKFCASGLNGFIRNLTTAEILEQVYEAEKNTGETINHIVVMGIGEPLDNYDNLKKFLEIIHDKEGKNLSYRNITVSTCGIVPEIKRFYNDFPQVNLAISLHRLDDEGRSSIMPINKKYPLSELLKACREYTRETRRRITFEYTLIKGVNDSIADIKEIKNNLAGMLCHVNVIPLNAVSETGYVGATRKDGENFARELEKIGITATVRRELGQNIEGACGQLRLKKEKKA